MKINELLLFEAAPTKFTGIDVVKSILGADKVALRKDDVELGQYLIQKGPEPEFTPPVKGKTEPWMDELGIKAADFPGTITLPNPMSRDAVDVAYAAHEAYHGWLTVRSPGGIFKNEKIVNQQATKWLKKNLTGMQLHSALETILKSKINYGHN